MVEYEKGAGGLVNVNFEVAEELNRPKTLVRANKAPSVHELFASDVRVQLEKQGTAR